MKQPIIQVSHLAKVYRLGEIGATSLREEFERRWRGFRKLESKQPEGDFWALRDLSFDVLPGEILGIIGKNGAGKSTLLKILSRITEPTRGEIRLRGRVAALLEVGTGFHPELTGRENIYLNGTILGMKKREIDRKLDEIIDFSGIERHIDTPVKRYSSGMNVRLGFSVAAHLEPEILVIDEVLAVGDAEFQSKCIGKMQDVAQAGRTVLFVSHQMASISRLTTRCIVLANGEIDFDGATPAAISRYINSARATQNLFHDVTNAPRIEVKNPLVRLTKLAFHKPDPTFMIGEEIRIDFEFTAVAKANGVRFSMTILAADSTPVGCTCMNQEFAVSEGQTLRAQVKLVAAQLAPGQYRCVAALGNGGRFEEHTDFDIIPDVLPFEIKPIDESTGMAVYWSNHWGRIALPDLELAESDN